MKLILTLGFCLLEITAFGGAAQAFTQVNPSQAAELCSGTFSCNREEQAPDDRRALDVQQPRSDSAVQGNCSVLPRGRDYQARPLPLKCGGGTDFKLRERYPHPQENLDRNFEFLQIGNREAAQKALLAEQTWTQKIPFDVVENWIYKVKRGAYTDCRSRSGYLEGGEQETYQTTCYRRGRKEKVVRKVHKQLEYCSRATPKPEPREESQPSGGGSFGGGSIGGGSFGGGSTGGGSVGGGSQPQRRSDPPPPRREEPKRGRGESEKEIKDRSRRGYDSSIESEKLKDADRMPSQSLRRIAPRTAEPTRGSTPTYGCDQWSTRDDGSYDEEVWQDVDDLAYSCMKVRNRWCTWLEDESASQACPEKKSAVITVAYKTPSDWNPKNPKYDDQLPNKSDLLLGESEIVKTGVNASASGVSPTLVPTAQFANELKSRTKAWNEYRDEWIPSTATCQYKDVAFALNVHTLHRNVQSAPNPLVIPKENGSDKPFVGLDEKGRPANLSLVNPTRWLVLDRSNLSRTFGESAKESDAGKKVSLAKDTALIYSGITRKFLENTRFWMRLWMIEGDSKVKISRFREFDINKASPDGENLNISLEGKFGMPAFYRMAVSFEKIFGFFGGDVALDPAAKYAIEIKLAQPSFDGIYLSGLDNDPTLDDEEKKMVSDKAYSESKYIPMPAMNTKRDFMDRFWNWRARKMIRPFKEKL
jgi:uncharacterized membrane protein YgcG